jgi:hypothetical protein
MTTLDYGRKNDLEEIYLHIKEARSSGEREHWERLASKILRESGATRELREKMLKAVRTGDRWAVRSFSNQLERLQERELNGHYFQKSPNDL